MKKITICFFAVLMLLLLSCESRSKNDQINAEISNQNEHIISNTDDRAPSISNNEDIIQGNNDQTTTNNNIDKNPSNDVIYTDDRDQNTSDNEDIIQENNGQNTTNNNVNQDPSNDIVYGEVVEYLFASAKDMHTYITTGSTNLEDYEKRPTVAFDAMPPAEVLEKIGYKPLSDFFDFDESKFKDKNASFQFDEKEFIFFYSYYLDDMLITVRPVKDETQTVFTYLSNLRSLTLSSDTMVSFSSNIALGESGYVKRSSNQFDIIYRYGFGTLAEAFIMVDGYFISVNATWVSKEETAKDVFESFMDSEHTSAFANLFSDNQEKFENAVQALNSADK